MINTAREPLTSTRTTKRVEAFLLLTRAMNQFDLSTRGIQPHHQARPDHCRPVRGRLNPARAHRRSHSVPHSRQGCLVREPPAGNYLSPGPGSHSDLSAICGFNLCKMYVAAIPKIIDPISPPIAGRGGMLTNLGRWNNVPRLARMTHTVAPHRVPFRYDQR